MSKFRKKNMAKKKKEEKSIDIHDIKECPDCASQNIVYNDERQQVICRDCGLIYEPLTPETEAKFESSHEFRSRTSERERINIQFGEEKPTKRKSKPKKASKKSKPKKKAKKVVKKPAKKTAKKAVKKAKPKKKAKKVVKKKPAKKKAVKKAPKKKSFLGHIKARLKKKR